MKTTIWPQSFCSQDRTLPCRRTAAGGRRGYTASVRAELERDQAQRLRVGAGDAGRRVCVQADT